VEARTELLQGLGNRIYRVEMKKNRRFSLRICPAIFQNRQWLEDELIWLEFVASRNQIQVPRPVRNRQGDLLTVTPTSEGDLLSCVFEWVEGQEVRTCLTIPLMREIGRTVASLHQVARQFTFPAKDNPFRADYRYDSTLAASHRAWIELHQAEIGAENASLLYAAIEQLIAELEHIGETPHNFGFIHADLHFGNFLVQEGRVSVIDFDQLGRGHYLYDIAVLVVELFDDLEQFEPRWQSFIAGYQEVTPLPFHDESELDPFIVAVNLAFLDWVYNAPNPAVRQEKMRWIPATYESIQKRLKIGS
jgi:Ser/Thr protein kinase RdoA (MazF antagonist)